MFFLIVHPKLYKESYSRFLLIHQIYKKEPFQLRLFHFREGTNNNSELYNWNEKNLSLDSCEILFPIENLRGHSQYFFAQNIYPD